MQKALIVKNSVDELNKLLSEGWTVAHSCAMPSSGSGYSSDARTPTCLVILQTKKKQK